MQFSDTSNLTGVVEDIDFLCGSNSVSYPLKDKARNVNRWLYVAISDLIEVQGEIPFSDIFTTTNATDNLIDDDNEYALPNGLLKLHAVEVLVTSSGEYKRLRPITIKDPLMSNTISDFKNVKGIPEYYELRGTNMYLYPAPDTTLVTTGSGLRYFVNKEIDLFLSTDTTQEVPIPEPYHRIISLGAAYDWLMVNGTQRKAQTVRQELEFLRASMKKFYSNLNEETSIRVRPAHRTRSYV